MERWIDKIRQNQNAHESQRNWVMEGNWDGKSQGQLKDICLIQIYTEKNKKTLSCISFQWAEMRSVLVLGRNQCDSCSLIRMLLSECLETQTQSVTALRQNDTWITRYLLIRFKTSMDGPHPCWSIRFLDQHLEGSDLRNLILCKPCSEEECDRIESNWGE